MAERMTVSTETCWPFIVAVALRAGDGQRSVRTAAGGRASLAEVAAALAALADEPHPLAMSEGW